MEAEEKGTSINQFAQSTITRATRWSRGLARGAFPLGGSGSIPARSETRHRLTLLGPSLCPHRRAQPSHGDGNPQRGGTESLSGCTAALGSLPQHPGVGAWGAPARLEELGARRVVGLAPNPSTPTQSSAARRRAEPRDPRLPEQQISALQDNAQVVPRMLHVCMGAMTDQQ